MEKVPDYIQDLEDGRMVCAIPDDDFYPSEFDEEVWQLFESGEVEIYQCYIVTFCKCCKRPEESEHVGSIVAKTPEEAIKIYIENYLK